MKIDLKQNLKDLSGKDILENSKPIPLNEVLANNLVQAKKIEGLDTLRSLDLSLELHKSGVMDLTVAERDAVKEFIDKGGLNILVSGQILKIIKESENKK